MLKYHSDQARALGVPIGVLPLTRQVLNGLLGLAMHAPSRWGTDASATVP
jgi:hypothetical protein